MTALAVETLGPDRVHCVSMPSRYSSEATRTDARLLAEGLGCSFREIPIGAVVEFPVFSSARVKPPLTIVGVVEDAVYQRLREPIRPTMYEPLMQYEDATFPLPTVGRPSRNCANDCARSLSAAELFARVYAPLKAKRPPG